MARKRRVYIENTPIHIHKLGLNQKEIFHSKEDFETFDSFFLQIAENLDIKIYSYVILKNSFRALISGYHDDAISKFMQILCRQYVLYYNKKYDRTGTIWDGRFKSSLVEKELFLERVVEYFELLKNRDKKEYKSRLSISEIEFIESCLNSGQLTGSDEFVQSIKNMTGVCFLEKKRGRPKNNYIKGDKMFKKIELLSKEKHSKLKLKSLENLLFAKDNPSFQVLAAESENVAKTFPIVFTSEESPALIAITSLANQNLSMNSEGKWLSEYVPAVYRKYPFAYANIKDNPEQKAVVIDVEAPNLSEEMGEALFDEEGNQTDLLKNTIQFLTSYEQESMRTRSIAKMILDAGILEDRELSIGEGEEKQVLIKGFKVVSVEKLHALSDEILASWVRNGIISFIDIHIKSLDNLENLMNLLYQRNN